MATYHKQSKFKNIPVEPGYMTTEEMSEIVFLSPNHITRLCRAGKLPGAVRQSIGRWIVPVDVVREMEQEVMNNVYV